MRFLIPIIVGAVIGYITNWLAIKMMFRPHAEKKFLGVHIPFTPGLIPKERERIARSVGQTIGEHLLSSEVIGETLSSERVNNRIRMWIEESIKKLNDNGKPIKDLVISLLGENHRKVTVFFEESTTSLICSQLKDRGLRDLLTREFKNIIFDRNDSSFYEIIRKKVEPILYRLSVSDELKAKLKNALNTRVTELESDQRSLYEIIPDSIIDAIKEYINMHDDEIVRAVKDIIEKPEIRIRLKASIARLISQNTSRVITMFMSPEAIANKLLEVIEKYIDDKDSNRGIISVVTTSLDKILECKVAGIVSGIPLEYREKTISQILDIILNYISNRERQSRLLDIIEGEVKSSERDIEGNILDLISDRIESILNSPKLKGQVLSIVHDIVENVAEKPVSCLLGDRNDTFAVVIGDLAQDIFHRFIKNKLSFLVELLNIPKIVENQMNGFDVAFAEELIIEIASRELRAITWLGALLGGIMGILSPLLQLLYR